LPITPTALIDKPDLWKENVKAFDAFLDLHTTRPVAFSGISRITHTEILSYCICVDLNPNEIIKKVKAADQDFLKWVKEKQENV
jgi:hypothetical protein